MYLLAQHVGTDGAHDVGRDIDRDAEDGGPQPTVDARGELPRQRGVPPSTQPLVLQQLCLHLNFVPGTLVLDTSTVRALILDTSTVRAYCVRSVRAATESFLRHKYMFFHPSLHNMFFISCLTYILIERQAIPTGSGSSSWAASPLLQPVFDPPPSDYTVRHH
jgi:hypothetical protein